MDEDLELSVGARYSIITMIFFVPYVICQFPANIVIRKIGAGLWLPSLVVAWGILCIGIGFTNRWTELLGCRIILGVLEAGYYPGKHVSSYAELLVLITSRLCVPAFMLVFAIRGTKKIQRVLPSRTVGLGLLQHPSLWPVLDGWRWQPRWLEMDIHNGRHHYSGAGAHGIHPDHRLPRQKHKATPHHTQSIPHHG